MQLAQLGDWNRLEGPQGKMLREEKRSKKREPGGERRRPPFPGEVGRSQVARHGHQGTPPAESVPSQSPEFRGRRTGAMRDPQSL